MNLRYIELTILFITAFTFADKELNNIYPIGQDSTLWCWAACCEMIFDAYKITPGVDQYDVANWAVGGINEGNSPSGNSKSVDKVLLHFGSIGSNYTKKPDNGQGNISKIELSTEIDVKHPIFTNVAIDEGNGAYIHSVLIKGYTGSGGSDVIRVIYNNPANGGSRQEKSYAEFVSTGNSWAWYETLRLTTNPPSEK
jgi:hypothetical protein